MPSFEPLDEQAAKRLINSVSAVEVDAGIAEDVASLREAKEQVLAQQEALMRFRRQALA